MPNNEQDKDAIIAQLRADNAYLKEQLRLQQEKIGMLIRALFGSKSEKLDANQLELLLDPDSVKKPAAVDGNEDPLAAEEHPSKKRASRKPRLPENIFTTETTLIPDEVKSNPESYRQVGEKRSEKLDVTPARYTRHVTIRPTYVERGEPIPRWLTAAAPASLLEGSILTPSLLAHVLIGKYHDHLPYYRQEKIMELRHGIHIPRNTLCYGTNFAADKLEPLYKLIAEDLRNSLHLNIDETPVDYKSKGGGTRLGYFWIYQNSRAGVLYDWHTGRAHTCLDNILTNDEKSFAGVLQSDGYSAYDTWSKKRPRVLQVGCWTHMRRKFVEAKSDYPEALKIIRLVGRLYSSERKYKEWIGQSHHPPEAIAYYRRRHLTPVLQQIWKTLKSFENRYLPQSSLGKAVRYALNQWLKLCNGLKHSPSIDNNAAENSVRPLKLGAKKWLFIGGEETGWRSAVIYTLIENIRREGKDAQAYLKWVFEKMIGRTNQQDLRELLPKAWLAQQKLEQNPVVSPAAQSAA